MMKQIINNLSSFIYEQKLFYLNNFQPISKVEWANNIWPGGLQATGWLNSTTKSINLNFQSTRRMLGFQNLNLEDEYVEFCKAMLVCSYRIKNGCSPQALQAELLTLKRWYVMLMQETLQSKPYLLTSEIIQKAMLVLTSNSSSTNLPDLCGNSVRLQEIINRRVLTLTPLSYVNPHSYTNKHNSNDKLLKIKKIKADEIIDDKSRDSEKLISIQTFLNIIKLTSQVIEPSEKILLYATMLLIVTGFRSIELFLLTTDALVKREMVDPVTKRVIVRNGRPVYYLGIRYFGAKGAGHRIHWVEPLAVPLVEKIFTEVQVLTEEFRSHIRHLRKVKFQSYLPQSLNSFKEDLLLVDDFYNQIISFNTFKKSKAELREATVSFFQRKKIYPKLEKQIRANRIEKYYSKSDIDNFLKNLVPIKNYLVKFSFEGKSQNIPLENFLFIVQLGSTTYKRSLKHITTFNILNNSVLNKWLGGANTLNTSVFEWYGLTESNGEFSSMKTHIPRHNINTFLALSGLSETLQAMMMGRTDIKQNQHYQHLAVLELKKAARSILLDTSNGIRPAENPTEDGVFADGQLFFSDSLDLEQNLKRHFHTFDGPEDVGKFIKSVTDSDDPFGDAFLQDFKAGLNETSEENELKQAEGIELHAHLYPVLNGSCMRDIRKDGCPARLKCLSGSGCCNFVVTGRKGELEGLVKLQQSLESSVAQISKLAGNDPRYQRALSEQKQNLGNVTIALEKTINARRQLIPVNVFPGAPDLSGIQGEAEKKTLVDLFAAEQVKIEMQKVRENSDE